MMRQLLQSNDTVQWNSTSSDQDSIFPPDLFDENQLRSGGVLLYILGIVYVILALIILSSEYLVPSLQVLRDKLGMSDDVAGASIISASLSAPALISNTVAVFVSHSQVRIGSIVGPAVFNILALLGISALFRRCGTTVMIFSWWSIIRNFSFYIFSVIIFTIFFIDNYIQWWEALILVTLFLIYSVFMVFNNNIKNVLGKMCCGQSSAEDSNQANNTEDHVESSKSKLATVVMFPFKLPFWLTLPDVRKPSSRKFFILTLLGSSFWICVLIYLLVWWSTVTGTTLGVPPEVMGLTVLALTSSLPLLVTGLLLSRHGQADAVLSLGLGINIFTLTLTIPVPWFLHSLVFSAPVKVVSAGLVCSVSLLLLMLMLAFSTIIIFRRNMSRCMGVTMIVLYLLFVALALSFQYDIIVCPL